MFNIVKIKCAKIFVKMYVYNICPFISIRYVQFLYFINIFDFISTII